MRQLPFSAPLDADEHLIVRMRQVAGNGPLPHTLRITPLIPLWHTEMLSVRTDWRTTTNQAKP